MVRTSVAHVVLFIAIVSVTAMAVGAVLTGVGAYAQSVGDEGDRDGAAIDAEVAIINDPEVGATYDEPDETVTLYVKNVGGSTLDPADLELLVDGEYVEPTSLRVLDGDRWRRAAVLEVTAEEPLAVGSHRALVDVLGARESLAFERTAE